MEKRHAKSKVMTSIMTNENKLVSDAREVLKEQANFYATLYKKDSKVNFRTPTFPINKLEKNEADLLEGEITQEEIALAIRQMKKDKSPGIDGLPADFYKVFYGRLKELLTDVFRECLKVKRIFTTGRTGIISLIPKKGKDLRWVKNWRPIILLCVDYKILSKIVANRIKNHLDRLVGREQTAFLKGRNITENIRKVIDTVHYCNQKQLNGLLLAIDFEKAFDRVDYQSLEKVMQVMGFGKNMVSWVQVLYNDFVLRVTNNGYFSHNINPTRGLFQGNPFSCYGFIIIIEFFALMLKNNKKIEGIKIGSLINLLSMFADDITLFIMNKPSVWSEVLVEISKFESMSGLKVNYNKSMVYRLGSARNSIAKWYTGKTLNWTDDPIDMLGIKVSHSDSEMIQLNIDPILQKARATLALWKQRGLSLIGKILIINNLAASMLIYRMNVLPLLGKYYYQEFNKIILDFLWDGKKAKIPLRLLQGNKDDGGLALFNIEARDLSLKAAWVFKMDCDPIIKELANLTLENKLDKSIWKCNLKPDELKLIIDKNNFWVDVWKAWCTLSFVNPSSAEQVKHQFIWNNTKIHIQKRPFIWTHWYNLGIETVEDLIDENGSLLTYEQLCTRTNAKVPFTEYHGLIQSIPTKWIDCLKSANDAPFHDWYEILSQSPKKAKTLYWNLNAEDLLLRSTVHKWEKDESDNIKVSEQELKGYILNVYKITNYPKARSFQYRLLTKALITNIKLAKWKIKSFDTCSFCNTSKESFKHLFQDCQLVQSFWERISKWLSIESHTLTYENIMCNTIEQNPKRVKNALILFGKMHIYTRKCMNEQPDFHKYKNYVNQICTLEKEIARKNDRLAAHEIKWRDIQF